MAGREPDETTVERVIEAIRPHMPDHRFDHLRNVALAAIGLTQGREALNWRAEVERFIGEYAVDPSINSDEVIEKRRAAVNRLRILLDKTDAEHPPQRG